MKVNNMKNENKQNQEILDKASSKEALFKFCTSFIFIITMIYYGTSQA
jgi:hypothetical protein